jgi:hypothetical protein
VTIPIDQLLSQALDGGMSRWQPREASDTDPAGPDPDKALKEDPHTHWYRELDSPTQSAETGGVPDAQATDDLALSDQDIETQQNAEVAGHASDAMWPASAIWSTPTQSSAPAAAPTQYRYTYTSGG